MTLLSIYLNDHLLAATGEVELFRRAAGGRAGTATGTELRRLAGEAEADREVLLSLMRQLGVAPRRYKVLAGWAAEKAGRLKPNGHLLTRSPLSSLVELDGLCLAVQAKEAGWVALRTVADRHDALDGDELDRLTARARQQADDLERLRRQAAVPALSP